jgi:hypothetical protein
LNWWTTETPPFAPRDTDTAAGLETDALALIAGAAAAEPDEGRAARRAVNMSGPSFRKAEATFGRPETSGAWVILAAEPGVPR